MTQPSLTLNTEPIAPTRSVADMAWFNAVWFQSVWLLSVLGRDSMLLLTISLLVLHFALVNQRLRELERLAAVAFIGVSVDAGLSLANVFIFANSVLVPLWLCCLWLGMAAALPRSLAFLQKNTYVTALAGAVVVPLNYWAGARLGAVEFGYSLPLTLAVMSLIWAILLPTLVHVLARIDANNDRAANT